MSIKLLTQADVLNAIVELGSDATKIEARIHVIAVSTLDHVRAHGDTRGCVALMNALPRGQRVKSLGYWFKHFSSGKLILSIDKTSKLWVAKLNARTDEDFKVSEACDLTFADLTVERDPTSVTMESFIRNIERTANNTDMHDGTDIPKVTPEARAVAARLVAFLREPVKAAVQ